VEEKFPKMAIRKKFLEFNRRDPNVIGYSEELMDEFIHGKPSGRKAYRFYVKKKKPLKDLKPEQILPEDIEGIPVDVVEIGDIKAQSSPTSRWRPLKAGISIGHILITAGTLGYFVTDSTGNVFVLSNNHVLANQNQASIGDAELQPAPYDGGVSPADVAATLWDFAPIRFDTLLPSNCPVGKVIVAMLNGVYYLFRRKTRFQAVVPFGVNEFGDNEIDAAIAKLAVDYVPEILGLNKVSDTGTSSVGMRVIKSGRTTGVTEGTIIDTNATITVNYGTMKTATFQHQIVIISNDDKPYSQGGDSGSLIIEKATNKAIALLFAGSDTATIANNINTVFDYFKVIPVRWLNHNQFA
jgi:hypothetical protein